MAQAEHNLDKLPKWARDRIQRLERQAQDLKAAIADPPPEARITKDFLVGGTMQPMAIAENHNTIDFRLDRPNGWLRGDRPPSISVSFERLLLSETDFGTLDIHTSDGRLVVLPKGANAVSLKVGQM